ncbi:hypothetical protein F4803DRAFT_567353 [Xylaria telfairii]|nr:hypothetical protein F4803DRAFT_567353 [Xylaria telfairii]
MELQSRPTDDPAQWDIDRVVEELCMAEGLYCFYEPGRLPADFEEQLRYNQIDGNQLFHKIKDARRQELFFQAIRIDKFTLQAKSRKFESITGEEISTASKRKGDEAKELSTTTSPTYAPAIKRDSGLANYNILYYDELEPILNYEVCAFNFLNHNTRSCVGH